MDKKNCWLTESSLVKQDCKILPHFDMIMLLKCLTCIVVTSEDLSTDVFEKRARVALDLWLY